MHRVLVLGAGKIGSLIAGLLSQSGDYIVHLADRSESATEAARAGGSQDLHTLVLDVSDTDGLKQCVRDHRIIALVSCLPYYSNEAAAQFARDAGIHYFDLTEDLATAARVRQIGAGASHTFATQCGLAPGFISIVASELTNHFDSLRSVKLRVGALPQHPNNVLKYSLNWSTDGLINEYGNPCQSIVDGQVRDVLPLEGLEEIEIDGTRYEAFNTSGGLGSLAESFVGRVDNMDYKTIRYPGHCELMRLLMNGLKLNQDRQTLKRILENAIPETLQDVVIIYAAVTGNQNGQLREENYVNKVYPQLIGGRLWAAIQVTTAAALCAVLDLVLASPDQYQGVLRQEQLALDQILQNRFGQFFAQGGSKDVSRRLVVSGQAGQAQTTWGSVSHE